MEVEEEKQPQPSPFCTPVRQLEENRKGRAAMVDESDEIRLRDLGLMRTKGKKFCTPARQVEEERKGKARTLVEDGSEEIKNLPKGTALREEYLKNEIAMDAASLWYHKTCKEKKIRTEERDAENSPIGMLVNALRAQKPSDYFTYNGMVQEKVNKWEEIFCKTGLRKRKRTPTKNTSLIKTNEQVRSCCIAKRI